MHRIYLSRFAQTSHPPSIGTDGPRLVSILRTSSGIQYIGNIQESNAVNDAGDGRNDVHYAENDGEFGSGAEGDDAEADGDAEGS